MTYSRINFTGGVSVFRDTGHPAHREKSKAKLLTADAESAEKSKRDKTNQKRKRKRKRLIGSEEE